MTPPAGPKVVQFERKLTVRQQEIQDEIQRILREWVLKAKRGEYVGIAIAGVAPSGASCTESSECEQGPALLGACYHLTARVHKDLQESSTPDEPVEEEPEEDVSSETQTQPKTPAGD